MVNAAKQAGGTSKPKPLAARNGEDRAKPYATESTVSEYLRQTAATEKALMTLSMEKSQLESEYAKMGITSAGRCSSAGGRRRSSGGSTRSPRSRASAGSASRACTPCAEG